MPRKTYVNRSTFEIIGDVDDHRDINFPNTDWSRDPSGLATLIAANLKARYWIFDPPGGDALREMTPAEKAVVDADPILLAAAKNTRRADLFAELSGFISSHYPGPLRTAISELRQGASGSVATALDAYFAWARRAWAAYKLAATAISAATSIPTVEGVTINYTPIGADPGISLDQVGP